MMLLSVVLIALGWSRSPFGGHATAGYGPSSWPSRCSRAALGGYFWNIGASRLGVAVASLWVNLVPFFAVLWSMAYGFMPNAYQIVGGLVALSGVVYMQWRKLQTAARRCMTVPGLKTRNCRWIDVPGAADERGRLNFLEAGKDLPFQPQRLFWLHHIAPGQWRGRHGHRESQLVLVAMHGGCRVHLDDGKVKETRDPRRSGAGALCRHLGVARAHGLLAAGAAILVIASTLYEDAEYLRDYDAFKREAASRP